MKIRILEKLLVAGYDVLYLRRIDFDLNEFKFKLNLFVAPINGKSL